MSEPSEPSKRVRKPSKAWLRSRGLPTDSESESGSESDDDRAAHSGVSGLATAHSLSSSNLAVPSSSPASTLPHSLSRQNSAASLAATTPAASSQASTRASTPAMRTTQPPETASAVDSSKRAAFEKRYANLTDEETLGTLLCSTQSRPNLF